MYIRSKKLKGAALSVAILVTVIVGVLLSLFVLLSRYNLRNVTVYSQRSQLYQNLESGLSMAQSSYFTPDMNGQWLKNRENADSICVRTWGWGAYQVISTQTKNRHDRLMCSGLYGTYMSSDTGLVVADNSRPVGISGTVDFKASCYLPRAGIRPAFIEGQSYQPIGSTSGLIKPSPASLQHLDPGFDAFIEQQVSGMDPQQDSLLTALPAVYRRGFEKKTALCLYSSSLLKEVRLTGNIKLVAGELLVDSSAKLEQVLIVCDKVHFKKGFKGQVHVIAKDSIVMEEDCCFDFPSSLVLCSQEASNSELAYIQFNKGCRLYGAVVAARSNSATKPVFVKLHAGAEVNGLVYSSDYLHLEGTLHANVYGGKLLLKTPSAVYENHLLSCVIDPREYSDFLAVPRLFGAQGNFYKCRNL